MATSSFMMSVSAVEVAVFDRLRGAMLLGGWSLMEVRVVARLRCSGSLL